MNDQLWQIYSDVVFYTADEASKSKLIHISEFYVLTACNPRGNILTVKENKSLMQNLRSYLEQKKLNYVKLLGSNEQLDHIEVSAAIICNYEQALSLALGFEQNAYYKVSEHKLYLAPALMERKQKNEQLATTYLADLRNRLRVAPAGYQHLFSDQCS